MITAIQIAIFLAAFLSKKRYVTLILAIASFLVPDEIPMIDEILMLAATVRAIYLDSKGSGSRERLEEIPAGKDDNDVGA